MGKKFKTSDLALCAALCCLNYRIENFEKVGTKVTFVITDSNDLAKNVNEFWSHQLKVDPLLYFNCLKEIKTRIYNH